MKICITIPAFNEEDTIVDMISGIKNVLENKYRYRIIVVDDGSSDNTAKIAQRHGALVFSHPTNYGLAETFRTEMEKALEQKCDIIVHIDADGQYKPSQIPTLLKPIIERKADLVIGSRFMGTIEYMPFIKKCGNKAFSQVISKISRMKITDAQSGFRAFTREVAEKVRIKSMHTYTQEMIIRASKMKFRILEVPVYFAKRKSGKSRLISNPLEYGFNAWINILRVYRDFEALKFFGGLGAIFFAVGFMIGVFIVSQIFFSGWYMIDRMIPSVMLSVLFLTAGIQIVLFGFLADKQQ